MLKDFQVSLLTVKLDFNSTLKLLWHHASLKDFFMQKLFLFSALPYANYNAHPRDLWSITFGTDEETTLFYANDAFFYVKNI